MVSLVLYNCKYCFSLPPLGQLPALKELSIIGFHGISCVDSEFYGNATKPFKYLETLTFEEMPKWEEWVSLEGEDEIRDFPALRELHIIECPKLIGDLTSNLPSLTILEIRDCQ